MDNNAVVQPPKSPESSKKKFIIPLLIVLALIAVVLLVFVLQKKDDTAPAASTSTVDQEEVESSAPVQTGVEEGVFGLSSDSPTASVGTPITISVKADSNGREVVGFDTVLRYDVTAFKLGEVKTLVTGFKAVSNNRKGFVEVTSFKDQASTVPPIFKDSEVLTVTLTPLKAGNFTIDLLDKADSSNTKYIDTKTEVYIPQVSGVSVNVK